MSPLRPEEIMGMLEGIEETKAGFGRGALAGQEMMTRQQYEDRKRGLEEIVKGEERVDVGVMDVLRDPEMGIMEDDEFRLLTPEEQIRTIREGKPLPGVVRRPERVKDAREQRLVAREERLEKQRLHRIAQNRRKSNKDLLRTSLALANALNKQWELEEEGSTEAEILTLQTDDSIKEAIRYAKASGINIRKYLEKEFTGDPGFISRVLRKFGIKIIPLPKRKKVVLAPTPKLTKTVRFKTEAEARAAGKKAGDIIQLKGVGEVKLD